MHGLPDTPKPDSRPGIRVHRRAIDCGWGLLYFFSHTKKKSMKSARTNGKQREFEREALPHMDLLYNYALRTTNNAADADDLLQDTYLKAFRFWDKYEKGTNIRAWLFRIMKNSYINRYRKEVKEPGKVDYDEVKDFYNSIRDDSTKANDLQESVFGNLLDDDVAKAIAELPEDFRTVVILCDIEGLPYEEIAQFVECPLGTVRSRLHRGRKLLRARLMEYARKRGYVAED
jgi:RNA polymerase sigma-70 factor (ECF subfamily)